MKRVFLSSPTYGPVEPEVFDATLRAVMFGGKNGIEWAGTASTDRESWESARNSPVEGLIDREDIDGIMWLDSDTKVPNYAFSRLVGSGHDLISALHYQRRPPYFSNAYGWDKKSNKFHHLMDFPDNTVMEIGGFGFGCCYTSMRLLRALPEHPFKFGEFSEDLGFCRMALKAGFQPYLDTGVMCDHYIGARWANRKLHEMWRSAALSKTPTVKGYGGVVLGGNGDGPVHNEGQEGVRGVPADSP